MNAGEIGKLAAFVLPLGVDTFAVAAAVGAAGVDRAARRRFTLVFIGLEGGMPLVGLALGAPLARAVGGAADYVAAAVLVAVGVWMLLFEDEDEGGEGGEERRAGSLAQAAGSRCWRWGSRSAWTSWRSGSRSASPGCRCPW